MLPGRARRASPAVVVAASLVVIAVGGAALGRWLDPTRRITWGGLGRQPPFAVPEFALVDADGHTLGRRDLLGHVWVADFVFLQCSSTCAVLARRMRELAARVPDGGVRFVSFSVDALDGPEVLARYRRRVARAGDDRWSFVAADEERFPRLAVGMGAATSENDVPAAFVQSGRYLFLVDRSGVVRGTYDGLDDGDARRLGEALAALVLARE